MTIFYFANLCKGVVLVLYLWEIKHAIPKQYRQNWMYKNGVSIVMNYLDAIIFPTDNFKAMIKQFFFGLLFIPISFFTMSQNMTIDAILVHGKNDTVKEHIPASGVKVYFASYLSDSNFVNSLYRNWNVDEEMLHQQYNLSFSNFNGGISIEFPYEKKDDLIILERRDLLPKVLTLEEISAIKSDTIVLRNNFTIHPAISIKKRLSFIRKKKDEKYLLEKYGFHKTSLQKEISTFYEEREFPGGYFALKKYINPVIKRINKSCLIILQIDRAGKVQNVEIKGINSKRIKNRLVEFFINMPKWQSGSPIGGRVIMTYVIPILIN